METNKTKHIPLYYHKTDGGAEYLSDTFTEWEYQGKSGREGTIRDARYIIRIDGAETGAELIIREEGNEDIEMLERENKQMAEALLKLGMTSEQVTNICNGIAEHL